MLALSKRMKLSEASLLVVRAVKGIPYRALLDFALSFWLGWSYVLQAGRQYEIDKQAELHLGIALEGRYMTDGLGGKLNECG